MCTEHIWLYGTSDNAYVLAYFIFTKKKPPNSIIGKYIIFFTDYENEV